MKRYFKEVGAELKKTVWPTKKDLVKYTGVVLAFIVVFAVVVGAMDFALVELLNLIVR
ncbi:preprotein translocase subunit SecE [Christensenella sp. MSJ-20]|nr:preprotein translocase subunit SecE [Christensenella sp. MSJ-20]